MDSEPFSPAALAARVPRAAGGGRGSPAAAAGRARGALLDAEEHGHLAARARRATSTRRRTRSASCSRSRTGAKYRVVRARGTGGVRAAGHEPGRRPRHERSTRTGCPRAAASTSTTPRSRSPASGKAAAIVSGKKVPFAVQVNAGRRGTGRRCSGAARRRHPPPPNPLGVNPICTREPACPLHTSRCPTSSAPGKPVAALFATPALCQSQYCGPVLDELPRPHGAVPRQDGVRARRDLHRRTDRRHAGAHRRRRGRLPSEPWLFAIDGTGMIKPASTARSASNEMKIALDKLASTSP